jgi:hypothetical protein
VRACVRVWATADSAARLTHSYLTVCWRRRHFRASSLAL